ncbi:MAG: cation diffusion facilitator family transporter [Candidatus Falkowbacteria bacterium]
MSSNHDQKKNVALSSVAAGGVLTIGKLVVGMLTGSMGILSEAAHSLLDWVAAIMTFFAVKFGDQPADDSHPYGHGKIESVSALIETGLLFITSAWIIFEASKRLLGEHGNVEAPWYAFAVVIVSIIIDISRSRALSRVAKATNSQALEADALHFSSDIYSSAVVLIGLVFVRFGVMGADAIAAVVVALFVTLAGYRLGKRTIDVLVDKAPEGTAEAVREVVQKIEGVVQINSVRARPLGPNIFVELSIAVNRKFSLEKTREIIALVKSNILVAVPGAEITVHTEPIRLDSETILDRVQTLAAKHNLVVHDIVADTLDNKQFVSYDLEVSDILTMTDAHDLATMLEDEIINELGDDVELNSHIEPLKHDAILSSNVNAEEMKQITTAITTVDLEIKEISQVHNVLVRKIEDKYFVSFHCLAPGELSLERVHDVVNHFEYLLKEQVPAIKRVVIHAEPL